MTRITVLATIGSMLLGGAMLSLHGCTDADIASSNLSKAADQFEITRRIVFYNGITGDYMLTIEGRCSLGNADTSKQTDGHMQDRPVSLQEALPRPVRQCDLLRRAIRGRERQRLPLPRGVQARDDHPRHRGQVK